jgi:hypothetical protein
VASFLLWQFINTNSFGYVPAGIVERSLQRIETLNRTADWNVLGDWRPARRALSGEALKEKVELLRCQVTPDDPRPYGREVLGLAFLGLLAGIALLQLVAHELIARSGPRTSFRRITA